MPNTIPNFSLRKNKPGIIPLQAFFFTYSIYLFRALNSYFVTFITLIRIYWPLRLKIIG